LRATDFPGIASSPGNTRPAGARGNTVLCRPLLNRSRSNRVRRLSCPYTGKYGSQRRAGVEGELRRTRQLSCAYTPT
jgi:hypothetical protein